MNESFLAYKEHQLAELDAKANVHIEALKQINQQKDALEEHILNFVYDDLSVAKSRLEDVLYTKACDSCGDGYHGDHTMVQDYVVNDTQYQCTGKFEYAHNDKVYFLDESSFKHTEVGPYVQRVGDY